MIAQTCKHAFALLVIGLAVGCSSTAKDPIRYYVIEPVAAVTPEAEISLAIAVDDLDIPQYLERFQIASRRTHNQISFASSHQWAENLRKNLGRALARNLTNVLGTPDVGTPASRSSSLPDYRVNLSIERFERDAGGYIQLIVRWQVVDGATRKSVITRSGYFTSDVRVSAKDYAGTVSEMSQLFADLAIEIGQAIRELQ